MSCPVLAITIADIGSILLFVATLILAGLTAAYVLNTRNTLWEMKEARDAETRPYVIVYFDVPHGELWADLVVKNVGKTVARNVKMLFDPPLQNTDGPSLMSLPMIRDGIPMLPPGYEIKTTLDFTQKYFKSGLPMFYNVTVTYAGGMEDKERQTDCVADLSAFEHLTYIERKDLHDLVLRVEKLTAEVKDFRRAYERGGE